MARTTSFSAGGRGFWVCEKLLAGKNGKKRKDKTWEKNGNQTTALSKDRISPAIIKRSAYNAVLIAFTSKTASIMKLAMIGATLTEISFSQYENANLTAKKLSFL
jgi:hypothetical protein